MNMTAETLLWCQIIYNRKQLLTYQCISTQKRIEMMQNQYHEYQLNELMCNVSTM